MEAPYLAVGMDVVKLIRMVKVRQPLWDRKHPYYHDRALTMGMWAEVAVSLGSDTDSIRAKWKGLRDTFRGELKKVNKSIAKGKPCNSTQWEYFDEMEFVKDQIYSNKEVWSWVFTDNQWSRLLTKLEQVLECRDHSWLTLAMKMNVVFLIDSNAAILALPNPEAVRNLAGILQTGPTLNKEEPTSGVDMADFCKTEVIEEDGPKVKSIKRESPTMSDSPPVSSVTWQPVLPLPPHQNVKAENEEQIPTDDDYNFLMSILPQLRSLPTTRNLFVRLKIQELLYHEIVALQGSSPT